MQAGRMRERVAIQSNSPTQNDYGEPVPSWSTDATVWASVRPVGAFGSGRERFAAGAEQELATMTHRVRMRYRSGVTPRHRLVWESRVLDIESVEDPDGKQHELVLTCREVVEESVLLASLTLNFSESGNSMYLGAV